MSEIVARFYLAFFFQIGTPVGELPTEISVFDQQRWVFDAAEGYRYLQNLRIHQTLIRDGRVYACRLFLETDAAGRPGSSHDPVEHGAIRIAMFGDSWSAWYVGGRTLGNELEKALSNFLGRPVHIDNYARGGYATVQMLDTAAAVLPGGKYDLALFAMITDDFARARHWRLAARINGEDRSLVSLHPTTTVDLRKMVDGEIVDARASAEWCQATLGHRDTVVQALEKRYLSLVAAATSVIDQTVLFQLAHSFLLDRVITGAWFSNHPPLLRPALLPRIEATDYKQLDGVEDNIRRISESGTPLVLLHIPTPEELAHASIDWLPTPQDELLAAGLENAFATHFVMLAPQLHKIGANPIAMRFSDTDSHPSDYGVRIYAEAAAAMLITTVSGARSR